MGNKKGTLHAYRQRALLAESIKQCKVALNPGPIRHLPPELISEVFRFCLPQIRRPDPSTAPLSLRQICSMWRKIALSTHDLWTCLDFSQETANLKPFIRLSTSPIHQWLFGFQRNQLDLSLDRVDRDIAADLISFVIYPKAAEIFRLEISRLNPNSISPLHHFFTTLPPNTFQGLKYLILDQELGNSGTITVFQSAPRLTHLSLRDLTFCAVDGGPAGNLPALMPTFPWLQLTNLVVTSFMQPDIWVAVLELCQCLEEGQFSIDLSNEDGDEGGSEDEGNIHACTHRPIPTYDRSIALAYLKQLDITVGCGRSFSLEDFYLPSLRALRFHRGHMHLLIQEQQLAVCQPNDFSWKKSLMFLPKLQFLDVLSVSGGIGSFEEVMVLLRHTPAVSVLDLNIQIDYGSLISALIIEPSAVASSMLLPRLNYLRIFLEASDNFPSSSADEFCEMVLSRSRLNSSMNRDLSESRLGNLVLASNSSRHRNEIYRIADETSPYVKTSYEFTTNSNRFISRRRHLSQGLWRA